MDDPSTVSRALDYCFWHQFHLIYLSSFSCSGCIAPVIHSGWRLHVLCKHKVQTTDDARSTNDMTSFPSPFARIPCTVINQLDFPCSSTQQLAEQTVSNVSYYTKQRCQSAETYDGETKGLPCSENLMFKLQFESTLTEASNNSNFRGAPWLPTSIYMYTYSWDQDQLILWLSTQCRQLVGSLVVWLNLPHVEVENNRENTSVVDMITTSAVIRAERTLISMTANLTVDNLLKDLIGKVPQLCFLHHFGENYY